MAELKDDIELAKMLSRSELIPKTFQGRPQDVMIALEMARSLRVSPIEAMNGLHVIDGRASFSAAFSISLANTRGPFTGPITYEVTGAGPTLAVTAGATLKASGDRVTTTVTFEMARREGWTRNPKYASMPEHMMKYRSAVLLIRTTCPEILMGYHTVGEITDIAPILNRHRIEELNAKATKEDAAIPAVIRRAEPKPEVPNALVGEGSLAS